MENQKTFPSVLAVAPAHCVVAAASMSQISSPLWMGTGLTLGNNRTEQKFCGHKWIDRLVQEFGRLVHTSSMHDVVHRVTVSQYRRFGQEPIGTDPIHRR